MVDPLSAKKIKGTYSSDQDVDNCGLKDITERDPVEESQKGLKRGLNKRRLRSLFKDFRAKLENLRKLSADLVLKLLNFDLRHLLGRVIEHLLREQAENNHVVFAECKISFARLHEFRDKCGPIVWPLLLENLVISLVF